VNMHRLNIRRIACWGLPVVLALSACSSGTSSSSVATTLVVDHTYPWVMSTDVDPSNDGQGFDTGPFFRAIYESLLTFNGGNTTTPVPLIAQSYTSNADATVFTFKIRQDVKFADGTPLTAHDVAFTYNRLINLQQVAAFLLAGITSAVATDDYTFVLTSKVSNPAIPFIITTPALGILNSKLLQAHGGTDAADAAKTDTAQAFFMTASAGSGPYVMSSVGVDQVVLKANTNYWGSSKPYFKTVIFRNVAAATELLEVPKATHQIELSLAGDQANSLKGNSKVQVQNFTSPNLTFLFCNVNPKVAPDCANPHFVEAVRYGIDYQGLAAVAGNGAVQAAGVVPDAFLGALPQSQAVQQNVTRAKSELQASGLSNPSITLDYITSSTGLTEALAAKIKADLAAVGINVTLNGQPSAIATPNYRGGTFHLGMAQWNPDYPDPNDYLPFLPGQLVGIRAGWLAGADPSLESLGSKASTTADISTRGQLFQQIQTQMNQEGPIYPLIHPGQAVVATNDLTNVTYNPQWQLDLAAIGGQ